MLSAETTERSGNRLCGRLGWAPGASPGIRERIESRLSRHRPAHWDAIRTCTKADRRRAIAGGGRAAVFAMPGSDVYSRIGVTERSLFMTARPRFGFLLVLFLVWAGPPERSAAFASEPDTGSDASHT